MKMLRRNSKTMQGDGYIEEAGGRLREVSLAPADWDAFAKSVCELASSRERRAGSFDKFVNMIKREKRRLVFLDAANIAFYNTMWLGMELDERFQWPQVKKVYDCVKERFPDRRIVVIVNNYRCRNQFVRTSEIRKFVDEWTVRALSSYRSTNL
jgi:hypothetical protein